MEQLGSAGTSGMEGMVMGFVYPSLKPMLEASIRRVTVKVMWREGQRERDLAHRRRAPQRLITIVLPAWRTVNPRPRSAPARSPWLPE